MATATITEKIVFINLSLPDICWGKPDKDGYSTMLDNKESKLWQDKRWLVREVIELMFEKNNITLVQAEGNTLWFEDNSTLNTADIRVIVAKALGGFNSRDGWQYFNYAPELVELSHYNIDKFEEPVKITEYLNMAA